MKNGRKWNPRQRELETESKVGMTGGESRVSVLDGNEAEAGKRIEAANTVVERGSRDATANEVPGPNAQSPILSGAIIIEGGVFFKSLIRSMA